MPENELNSFIGRLNSLSEAEIELPIPESMKYWAPVTFPAGRPFVLTVNVYYSHTSRGTEVIFNCPALTAGKGYTLGIEIKNARKACATGCKDKRSSVRATVNHQMTQQGNAM